MKLYNTASRQDEEIKPIAGNLIKLYTCGPTVYDKPTIGNWASFIRYDILARVLSAAGLKLDWIMNITDVGHLVSDGDEGEDKLEKGARRESKTAWEIAQYYSEYFINGLNFFNISISESNIARATDYINQQIELVKLLESKGHTYLTADGVYFDSTTFADYGKMARLDLAGLQEGARVSAGDKKHPTDFALWKFSPKDGKRDMQWDSPWGKGFPGWHLECSAIIKETLGESIDIHAGGIEHIPVHHTNEIAQSESATGKKLANIWVHNNHLQIDGHKISKSLNNGFIIEDLKTKGYNGLDFRMFVLRSNYRTEANFTWNILEDAKRQRLELQAAADLRFQKTFGDKSLSNYKKRISSAVFDNLNTPLVLSILSEMIDELSEGLIYKKEEFLVFLNWLNGLLGLELTKSKDITSSQKELIDQRESARNNKDWQESDKLRDEIAKQGIAINDTPNGPIWQRLS